MPVKISQISPLTIVRVPHTGTRAAMPRCQLCSLHKYHVSD